jgi:hypothetical protein
MTYGTVYMRAGNGSVMRLSLALAGPWTPIAVAREATGSEHLLLSTVQVCHPLRPEEFGGFFQPPIEVMLSLSADFTMGMPGE